MMRALLVFVVVVASAQLVLAQEDAGPSVRDRLVEQFENFPLNLDTPIEEIRAAFDAGGAVMPLPPGAEVERMDVAGMETARISIPDSVEGRIVLYLHGGGYVFGSIESYTHLAAAIGAAMKADVLLPEYRLAPEHPFPAAVEDGVAAYRWMLENGHDPERIVIAGDSAGGGLTIATLISLRDAGEPLPACAYVLSPWADLTGSGESIASKVEEDPLLRPDMLEFLTTKYLADETDPRNPLVSPVFADLRGLPPLLIHVGSDEIILNDSTRLATEAAEAEVDVTLRCWPDMFHVWQAYHAILPEAREALEEAGAFIAEHMSAAE